MSMEHDKVCVEYIWIDAKNELRLKTKVIDFVPEVPEDLPNWNFDGSSTNQAKGENTEIIIKPVALFNDPFKEKYNYLVLCETYNPDNTPHKTNHRHKAKLLFDKKKKLKPWFGMEQEYFIIDNKTNKPLGFPKNKEPNPQGQYYCSVGSQNAYGRYIAEEHLDKCLKAGVKICGINGEVPPGQWEYQVGICEGIEMGDHLWMARYILEKISEKYNVTIEYHPKPIKGDWNGSGCHTNFSNKYMREGKYIRKNKKHKDGLYYINQAIDKLSKKHKSHMKVYGKYNQERMTGIHETASYDKFTHGVGTRNTSIRVGNDTYQNRKGYFEDRRPSSNCEPYLVTYKLFKTCCC